ncbi:MAG: ferritin-like domain-containing protein [Promethearchaeota archaeon]|jgi:bacterioferritin
MLKVTSEYLELLNKAVAREIQVSAQYMLQHTKMEKLLRKVIKENILLDSTTYEEFGKILKDFAIEEMKHLATIMERIYILGGEATTKPDQVTIGNSIKEFAQIGIKAEEEALEMYRTIINAAQENGDRKTWSLFTQIYNEEEEHLLKFQDYSEVFDEADLGETPESEWRSIFNDADYIGLLNKALAAEISASIQYTTQHEKAEGLERMRRKKEPLEVITGKNKASVISGMLKTIFLQEMEHMERIAERIFEIDREALAQVDPLPEIGEKVDDFITLDREAENYAIVLYRKIIEEATKKGDIKTKRLFEDIIQQEEEHYWMFDDFLP